MQILHEDVKRRRFREVTCAIKHIHKTTDYVPGFFGPDRWTVHYNTFSATVVVPVYDLRDKGQEIYCPYCGHTIAIIAKSDRACRIGPIITWVILLCIIVGLGALGYHNNGINGLVAYAVGGLVLGLFIVLLMWRSVIKVNQFSVGPGHEIYSKE